MMEKSTALEKRIKRQVTARDHRFFVVVSPGLLDVCLREMKLLFNDQKTLTVVDGGIEFDGSVTDCYLANLHLRTASRIIMRLGSFTASDFATLEKKIETIPWELYLEGGRPPTIQVTLKKSRLYHSGAVEQRFRDMFTRTRACLEKTKPRIPEQTLFVRAFQDRFEVSLDSSGELLYLRGLKTQGGIAPLRETLAAGMLMLAGYDGTLPLIDPMCGTGSFSLEAAMIAQHIPPGWFRNFAFEHWPCFRPGSMKNIRREAEALIRPGKQPMIFSSDQDPEACNRLKAHVAKTGMDSVIQVAHRDLFAFDPERLGLGKGLVMVNPPYGLRIGTKMQSEHLIRDLFELFEKKYQGWTVGLISPLDTKTLKPSFPVKSFPLFHGGLSLFFLTGRVGLKRPKRSVSR